MTPIELFQEGKLTEAIQAQDRFASSHPRDAAARLLLCELLQFDGNLETVREHLDRVPRDAAGMDEYLNGYRHLLDAEAMRQRILFSAECDESPIFLLEPPRHLIQCRLALDALRRGNPISCAELLDKAEALFHGVDGHVDGREFHGVRDGDDLFAYVLEVLINGQYTWFPFDQIGRLRLGSRDDLRDRLFVPATLQTRTGEEWLIHLPALYPGTHLHEDEEVRSGQATDWFADDDGPIRGVGLRVFTFGEEELTLLDFTLWEG